MKSIHNNLLITFLFSLIHLNCWLIGEPLQEARYRDKGNRIKYEDANHIIEFAVLEHMQRCGSTSSSIYLQFLVFLHEAPKCSFRPPIGPNMGNEFSIYTGCADVKFLHRDDIEKCKLLIGITECARESDSANISFLFCSAALNNF